MGRRRLAGGAAALTLVARGQLARALPAGRLLIGLPLLALAWLPLAVAALVCLVVLGIGYSLVEVAGLTLLQRLRPRSRPRPRVRASSRARTG